MKALLKALIKIYAACVSPFLGRNCRFQPSCSLYAHDAIEKHGALKGTWLAIKRLSKCHPWNKSDPIDPVPPKAS
ncbi:MAG: membrane protein insertion efficiency factor YidD [Alphaproteobacteria bacterium]|nr:membrane protein insertion efficiency factor YidD [Alphaproteobacteria bacterium]